MIVGTAGHIDHGKTTLTRALTGVDTDRLKEEKARGISIELGYAYLPLAHGGTLGIIDVPGHEKFIRTMAAGVTGIDVALLVIAADDGVMPQTREHLAILRLLGVRRGVVALTKADRADAARLAQVESDIRALLAYTDFHDAPLFRTSASKPGDAGVAALLACLAQLDLDLARHPRQEADQRLFRLGVDRVFTLTGQGTVVTGTALAGTVAVGDTLTLAPGGQQVRVRGIHAQNCAAQTGHAGQRLALNLAGAGGAHIGRDDIARGSWVVAPAMAECSARIDVELTLAPDCGLSLKPWSPVHVHLGAAHHTAHVVPLQQLDADDGSGGSGTTSGTSGTSGTEADTLAPGRSARVQLVLDGPVHAVPGDRFVLRNAQASATIGGGVVLDPFGPARKRRGAVRLAWLAALSDYAAHGDLAGLLEHSPLGLRMSLLTRLSQRAGAHLSLPEQAAPHARIALPGGDALLISGTQLARLEAQALAALAAFHARAPDDAGPELWRLKRIVSPDMEDRLWSHLVATLAAQGLLCQRERSLHLPGHSVELSEQEQALARPLLAALRAGRYDPPWVRDLARSHALPESEVRRLLLKLSKAGQLSQLVPDLFYHPAPLAELAQLVAGLPEAQAAAFRDATGLGRKRAIQVLEFFDRVGYTRRLGNVHLVRPNANWARAEAESESEAGEPGLDTA